MLCFAGQPHELSSAPISTIEIWPLQCTQQKQFTLSSGHLWCCCTTQFWLWQDRNSWYVCSLFMRTILTKKTCVVCCTPKVWLWQHQKMHFASNGHIKSTAKTAGLVTCCVYFCWLTFTSWKSSSFKHDVWTFLWLLQHPNSWYVFTDLFFTNVMSNFTEVHINYNFI